jgi:hypothetical protein
MFESIWVKPLKEPPHYLLYTTKDIKLQLISFNTLLDDYSSIFDNLILSFCDIPILDLPCLIRQLSLSD